MKYETHESVWIEVEKDFYIKSWALPVKQSRGFGGWEVTENSYQNKWIERINKYTHTLVCHLHHFDGNDDDDDDENDDDDEDLLRLRVVVVSVLGLERVGTAGLSWARLQ